MSFENKYMSVEQYLRKLSGLEKEVLLLDHNYVKSWNAHPDSHRTKPARLLFLKGMQRYPLSDTKNYSTEIDIETCDEDLTSPFDNPKLRVLANECERHLRNTQLFKETDQEAGLDLSNFTPRQQQLYQQVIYVLNGDRLAKLCSNGTLNEPLKRRLSIDKAARQIRQIFGLIFWNMELLSWLHETLLNHSDISTLSTYMDVLQSLRAQVPILVDRLVQTSSGTVAGDAVIQLMKKPWDPVIPVLNQNKAKKLPGNPIILICPSSPNQTATNVHSQRLRFWQHSLGNMCKVINVAVHSESGRQHSTIEECLDHMMEGIRAKVTELKNHYPSRPLILLGWTIGALIACHIALQEPVDGVICLGFPLTGVNGSRGDLNDPLLDNKVPTLYIIGQNARMCSTDDIEDFRSRMRVETGLVIVGGADDMLRMNPLKMKMECVNQSIVDRCLLDEISEFLVSVVVKLPSTSALTTIVSPKVCTPIKEEVDLKDELWKPKDDGKRKRRKPREYSPELSPVRKRQRHMSRQVSSSNKTRLSSSNSETSSSGSCLNEKNAPVKPVKKSPDKRIGRPTAGTWRKRTSSRPTITPNAAEKPSKKLPIVEPIISTPETKPSLPFSKNILPKRNEPVDVDKAFGSDSSFLPRPLTPPEPEDTVSAEETEKAMAELEAMANSAAVDSHQIPISSLLDDVLNSDRSFLPISEIEAENKALEESTPAEPVAVSKPEVSSPNTAPMVSVSLAPSLQNVLAQNKVSGSSAIQAVKTATGLSILSTTNTTSVNLSNTKSTIITVPSASAASLLASGSSLRTQSGKVIQLITKSGTPVIAKSTTRIIASGLTTAKELAQSCNLSLLSDVAGCLSEPPKSKKFETTSPAATLVKLAVPDKPVLKCLKVVKTVSSPSQPTRFETAEEMVEKQLAIQALNKSIGIESGSNIIKESGYSICYAKADGSIVSRSVSRPNFSGIVSAPSGIMAASRGRGRGQVIHKKNF